MKKSYLRSQIEVEKTKKYWIRILIKVMSYDAHSNDHCMLMGYAYCFRKL